MDKISKDQCQEYLNILGCVEIAKIFEAKRRPKITVTDENMRILEAMKANHFIRDYEEDPEKKLFTITRAVPMSGNLPEHLL